MACKESICRKCFHSYVCEKFNENKDDNNEKCHFFNDHYVPTADVVPRAEVERLKDLNKYLMSELSKAREQIAFMKRAEELDKIPKW